jgi:hypothetical protein
VTDMEAPGAIGCMTAKAAAPAVSWPRNARRDVMGSLSGEGID